jgi:UDP-N-acetylglucosamine--N-acetylmuramyl-(pentapeptide) pyrophosphoryl-undecaprenol N-acetylglucosamine transferase
MTLIVAGGGTGGHVLAGVAVADAWKKKNPMAHVLFVGAKGGLEEKLVPRAGYPLELLSLGALKGVGGLKRLKTLIKIPLAMWASARILIRERPSAVLGVGGYASGPLVMMARLLRPWVRARVAILEQNAVPGFTNRVLSHFSDQVFVAFEGIEKQFPGRRALLTGNPTRAEIQHSTVPDSEPRTIFVFGGSQGAMGINSLVIEALPQIREHFGWRVEWVHQTGARDFERVRDAYQAAGLQARVEPFIYDMNAVYARASLLICRAGSSTLSEIAAVGRPSILIPFPQAADNHQEKNAMLFVNAGAARLLKQGTSNKDDLVRVVSELMQAPRLLSEMGSASLRLARPGAAERIVDQLS